MKDAFNLGFVCVCDDWFRAKLSSYLLRFNAMNWPLEQWYQVTHNRVYIRPEIKFLFSLYSITWLVRTKHSCFLHIPIPWGVHELGRGATFHLLTLWCRWNVCPCDVISSRHSLIYREVDFIIHQDIYLIPVYVFLHEKKFLHISKSSRMNTKLSR